MRASGRHTAEMIGRYVDAGYWRPELTVDFWDRNARERPQEAALADRGFRFTWHDAAASIERLACAVQAEGFATGEVLLVQAQNSANLMFLRLACEKAGVIPVFLNHGFRRAEIERVVALTEPAAAIYSGASEKFDYGALYDELARRFPSLRRRYLIDMPAHGTVGSIAAMLQSEAAPPPLHRDRRIQPYATTGVVTSSGTTGLPKCVAFSPWPRLASARVYIERLRMTAADVVVACIPLYTGGADLLFHTAPQAAAMQVLLDAFTPEAFCAAVEHHHATGAIVVPTMLSRLLSFADLDRFDLTSLRFLTCGGGALPYEIGRRIEDRLGAKIIQGYGLMDYGALASHGVDDPQELRLRSNGRVLDGTELRIVDERGTPLPPGTIGEICAQGPHCVAGYFNDATATAAAWPGGFFHTGDLGRIDEEGFLVLEGRSKDIIIRGGQNISASEVEDVLCRHPGIAEAAVVRMPDAEMGERACAFIVPRSGATPSLAEIGRFMRQEGVAAFKIPERVELIDELPMNRAGNKVNKSLLEESLRHIRINAAKDR